MALILMGVQYFIQAPITIHSGAILWYGVFFFTGIGLMTSFYDNLMDDLSPSVSFVPWIMVAILVILVLVIGLTGSQMFNAKKYASLVEVQEGVFTEDIPSANETSIMDQETAQVIGSRVMGEIDNVSQYNISDEYNMIIYNGQTYRVSPLEYASDIKAIGNKGISGYVLVNCNTQEAKLVKLDEKIMYSPSSVFGYDLVRHIRKSYPSALLGKAQFEIDEEGKPYYIMPVYKTTIGLYSGKVLDKVLIVNAVDGNIDEYAKDNVPEWVEHTDSIEHLAQLATYNLRYKDGFLNSIISQKNVKNISYNYKSNEDNFKGYSSVKTNKGIEYFTGVTSVNADESILGFLFLNPKNGQITMYDCVGAEESSAMESAEALVQNYNYVASYPFIVNVNGIETYLIALKDKTGTNKSFALVNVKNYTISTQASSKEDAIKQYIDIMNKKGVDTTETTNNDTHETENNNITAKITAIYTVSEEGTTYYYYTLEGYDKLFISSILNNRNQVKLNVGDSITVTVKPSDEYYTITRIEF